MNKGVWFGAALGCLGWLPPGAEGQAYRPADKAPVVRAMSPSGGASLGRPIARGATPGLIPVSYRSPEPAATPIPAYATLGKVIATSGATPPPPAPLPATIIEEEGSDLFAGDRREPSLLPVAGGRGDVPSHETRAGAKPMPSGPDLSAPKPIHVPEDWKRTYDAPPLVPRDDAPVMMTMEPPARWYVGAEYLLWRTKTDRAPVLVTAGSLPIIDGANRPIGSLGRPDTVILQDGTLNHGWQPGARFTAGFFLDDCGEKALEVSGFFLGQRSAKADFDTSRFFALSRPFFDVNMRQESVEVVTFQGAGSARVSVRSPSRLWGAEANLSCKACCGCDWRVNWLGGVRFLDLRESLTIQEDVVNTAGALAGTRNLVTDRFATRNQFYGGQIGAEGRWMSGQWTLDGKAKLAVGVTQQSLEVSGSQVFLVGTNPDPRPGGLLALPSNIGSFSRSRFAVVPEIGVNLGYYVNRWTRVSAGYNFLYWSDVARPGDQIDRNINTNQVPNFGVTPFNTNPPPQRLFRSTDYWAHGLTLAVELNF